MAVAPAKQSQPAQVQPQYSQVYKLGLPGGIKRDGTIFETPEYTDGVWCRFQRQVPKKIGGYTEIFSTFDGILRGLTMQGYNGVNYVFAGTSKGLDIFATGQSFGIGAGPYRATLVPGYSQFPVASTTISASNTTSFTIDSSNATPISYTSVFPTGTKVIFTQSGTPLTYTVTTSSFSTPNTVVNFTPPYSGSISNIWLANYTFSANSNLLWQFDYQYNPTGGALNLVAHPGLNLMSIDNAIKSQVYIGSILPNSSQQWVFNGLADTSGTAPTYQAVAVDGGVCVLHPFIFVFGSNGFIANNNVSSIYLNQSLTDWNGPLANQVNVASGKVVKGLPIRGGGYSPAGLFWATDSLIRVLFTGTAPDYWTYDIVSSQISIMSSSAAVEMDGLYYWMGVDRFYVYDGRVTVVPNDKNVNWLFNNLNYSQRQKVWATKVPRYNELWFFYPRGDATECTDAIIYNVKDKLWYDAGQATGARRSCGYTTEVFPTPVWAGWDFNATFSKEHTVINHPSVLPAANSAQAYFAGNLTPAFSPGAYISFNESESNTVVYQIASSQYYSNAAIGVAGVTLVTATQPFSANVTANTLAYVVEGGYPIWQHETGLDQVSLTEQTAIYSSYTTGDISWVGGTTTPSNTQAVGNNRRMHIRRIEPDFVQGGNLALTIVGRKFANSQIESSGPFIFDPSTEKIDLRVEYREVQLKVESNEVGGNYEQGRLLITQELGDERP
jgi:hypothetical protein